MLRSELEFVCESYARCLATTERTVPLDVSRFVSKRYPLRSFNWETTLLPPNVIREFQRNHFVVKYYVGGMCESIEPNACLIKPPIFVDYHENKLDVSFVLQPFRAEWDDFLAKKKGVRVIRYGRYTMPELVDLFWERIAEEMRKHHRSLLERMNFRQEMCVHTEFMHEFRGRIKDELLRLWITPYKAKTLGDSSPLTWSKQRQHGVV